MATGGGGGGGGAGGTAVVVGGAGEERASASRSPSRRFFVALHVGAGFHAPANERAYRQAMKRACLAAAAVLRRVRYLSSTKPLAPRSLLSPPVAYRCHGFGVAVVPGFFFLPTWLGLWEGIRRVDLTGTQAATTFVLGDLGAL
jgi:hypothetical protein